MQNTNTVDITNLRSGQLYLVSKEGLIPCRAQNSTPRQISEQSAPQSQRNSEIGHHAVQNDNLRDSAVHQLSVSSEVLSNSPPTSQGLQSHVSGVEQTPDQLDGGAGQSLNHSDKGNIRALLCGICFYGFLTMFQ